MSPATAQLVPAPAAGSHSLQCMEIWSGNNRVQQAVTLPGLDAWVYSRPCEDGEHGGDVHYISTCGAGKISRIALADVSGHGDTVSQTGTRLRRLMRKYINTVDQTRFARALNVDFAGFAEASRFATALLVTYFAPNDHLIICNVGHPRPLWYRAAEQTWSVLDHGTPHRTTRIRNLPLGIIPETQYSQFAVPLGVDDILLLYTDALIEARNPAGDLLSEDGLLEKARGLDVSDPATIGTQLLKALDEYRGHAAPDDDQTLIVLHHNAAEPPKQSLTEMARVMGKMVGLIRV